MSGVGPMYPNEKPEHPYLSKSYVGNLLGNYSLDFARVVDMVLLPRCIPECLKTNN